MSTVAGLQVPVNPLSEVVGNAGTPPPAQMAREFPKLNVGGIFGFTVTVKVVGTAHNPALGVKVYVAEFWLSTVAGLQVPFMLLVEMFGNAGTAPPLHMVSAVPKVNVGVTFWITVTFLTTGIPHWPAVGVKV